MRFESLTSRPQLHMRRGGLCAIARLTEATSAMNVLRTFQMVLSKVESY